MLMKVVNIIIATSIANIIGIISIPRISSSPMASCKGKRICGLSNAFSSSHQFDNLSEHIVSTKKTEKDGELPMAQG
jgi:hypothetical protein